MVIALDLLLVSASALVWIASTDGKASISVSCRFLASSYYNYRLLSLF